jgi:hypothetical protein
MMRPGLFKMIVTGPCLFLIFFLLLYFNSVSAQNDSTVTSAGKVITLREVVVRSNLNVAAFIERVKDDTSFYKAFRNLHVLGYTSLNDVQLFDKKGKTKASLSSRTHQHRSNGCRWNEIIDEKTTGDFYNKNHDYNYYTAELYASLFFATDTICGENNIVKGTSFSTKGKSSMEKHKEQLKMLFFNPGKRIPGLPFMGNKVALFDEDVSALYDFVIDMELFKGEMCYVFRMIPRADLTDGEKSAIVINEMITWFRIDNWQIVARNYDLSYKTGVYDFDVHMEVEMTEFENYVVPKLLRYNGDWDVMFKKRERAVFTATLFEFKQ